MMCDFPDPPAALKQDACTARIVDKANAAGSASGAIGAGRRLVNARPNDGDSPPHKESTRYAALAKMGMV